MKTTFPICPNADLIIEYERLRTLALSSGSMTSPRDNLDEGLFQWMTRWKPERKISECPVEPQSIVSERTDDNTYSRVVDLIASMAIRSMTHEWRLAS